MKKILSFLWKYVMTQKMAFFGVLFSMILAFSMGLFVPLVYKNLINIASLGTPGNVVGDLYHWGYIFIGLIFLQQVGWKSLEYWIIPLETRICRQIYEDAMTRMIGQSNRFFTQNFSGSIVRTISRLVDTTENLLDMFVYQIGRMFISILVMTIILARENIWLGIVVFVWMISVIIAKRFLWSHKMRYNEKVSQASTRVSARLSDVFTNAMTVLTCGMQREEIRAFRSIVGEWFKVNTKSWWIDYGIFFVTTIFIVTLQIVTIFGSIYFWSIGAITVGTFVLLIVYLTNFIDQAVEVNFLFRNIYRSGADMVEAIELLETPYEIIDKRGAKTLNIKGGEIYFDHVNFTYGEGSEEVLQDFTLLIRPGEKVALVGFSGSGKSTILKLLFRLYDITSGTISIDGQSIAEVTQESLRRNMAMVPQDSILFHRTIAENIAYTTHAAPLEAIQHAAKLAYADDFIVSLPDGYDTVVGERGVKLSGGERQRVSIARAILANKPIFVLDEATSSLDSASEKCIQSSLHEVMEGRTAIVIAHRLSTIMQMDRIIVLDGGKIVEQGTHMELLSDENGFYKKLWDIQTGEFIRDI